MMTDMSKTSMLIALDWHEGQRYGERPYIHHIEEVVNNVRAMYPDHPDLPLLIHTAYLHDVLEDTDCTAQEIRQRMHGYDHIDRLIHAIEAISKQPNEKRTDYLARCANDPVARKVKIADSMANLANSFRTGESRRIKKYLDQLTQLHHLSQIHHQRA